MKDAGAYLMLKDESKAFSRKIGSGERAFCRWRAAVILPLGRLFWGPHQPSPLIVLGIIFRVRNIHNFVSLFNEIFILNE